MDTDLVKLPYECLHLDSRTTTVLSDIALQLAVSNCINIDVHKAQILSGHILFMMKSIFLLLFCAKTSFYFIN